MAKLNWKESCDGSRVHEALASRAIRGKYSITNRGIGFGFLVRYRPPPEKRGNRWFRWWWQDIGIAATASEAVALAQANNDKRAMEATAQKSVRAELPHAS